MYNIFIINVIFIYSNNIVIIIIIIYIYIYSFQNKRNTKEHIQGRSICKIKSQISRYYNFMFFFPTGRKEENKIVLS